MKRNVYLDMKTIEEAQGLFLERFGRGRRTEAERVEVSEALGRITAEPVFARWSVPTYHSAAMDGAAVRAADTYGATETRPRRLEIGKEAVWINTGQPMPAGFNAVIMIEKIHPLGADRIEIRASAYPWQNVRKVGEDVVASQLLFTQDHRIRPYDIGALISAGVFDVPVRRRPLVAIIPTGTEIVPFEDARRIDAPEGTQIVESNAHLLSALVEECGGEAVICPVAPDQEDRVRQALQEALDLSPHVVIVNAGSSAGSRDFTAHAIGSMGEILVHGVAMMPGKPTILADVGGRPVVGNPGYAVSSVLSFEHFVKPLLYRLQGRRLPTEQTVVVTPVRDIPSKPGVEEFLRVNIGQVGGRYVAVPLPRAAGSITSLTRAEGLIRVPLLTEGISRKETVEATLLVDREELSRTVVMIGSHDMTIDILADELRRLGLPARIVSGNVGSLGGLLALKKGSCHMAGSHLLDVESGRYNLPYIERYLKEVQVAVFHLALRDQGLMVAKGNPKGIESLQDLTRPDVLFVNRQAGSGTRVLLDYSLQSAGIDSADVRGYDQEEFTHTAVAVDVVSGVADCGMGIFAAAKALDLDFIPVVREQYDVVVLREALESEAVRMAIETMRSDDFRRRVTAMGGYDPSRSGELWQEVG
ncbi:Molybdenum cofactor synthesis domain protein [uncultured Desulfatiglans sp.]|uniref:Molybdopterin molybdenumtransferase n=1 Tax=Uncultured Desulfatiglans sp. TaxID=1748965 RepID=A0A653AG03_UNCDX|nr:Molybdenum cofactor synthesis domain protein [uncultured Desulfatiglans sp.]